MRYIAAYLLLQTGGNASPSAADIKKLLDTVGIETDDERLNKLISELEGKDINEQARVRARWWCCPAAAAGGAAAGGAAAAEEKKEEKVEEKEESDDDMGFGLFD
ncbi:hypothetical protein NMY22_g15788 [Coprinellus aureogranulatus]|nr:hypothetical protein NMY22_g15788 [Coprinellus aureogranulatus]